MPQTLKAMSHQLIVLLGVEDHLERSSAQVGDYGLRSGSGKCEAADGP